MRLVSVGGIGHAVHGRREKLDRPITKAEETRIVDVARLVDDGRIGWFHIRLLVWSFLAIFADGYDAGVVSFAAPALAKAWQTDRAQLTPVLTAGVVGILFGAPLFGYLADRRGRKTAIVLGCFVYGVFTLAGAASHSLLQLTILRFLTGIGLGGLMPTLIALNAEYAPARYRSSLVILMFTGITVGTAAPGWVSVALLPIFGWPVLFLVGGALGIGVALCLILALPESLKFLALSGRDPIRALRLARALRREPPIADDAVFTAGGGAAPVGLSPARLFRGGLGAITTLLWLLFIINMIANFFLNSWLPTLFQDAGLSPRSAALISSSYSIGGALGGLTVSFLIDRFGLLPVAILFALACPVVALIGMAGLDEQHLTIVVTSAGFCVLGLQFGLNALSALLYPTEFRASGVGWAFAIGRVGSIIGPVAGGVLIGRHLPLPQLFAVPAVPLALGAVLAAWLARLCYRRFGGLRVGSTVQKPTQFPID